MFVRIVPRALNRFIEPEKVYPLYGFHYWVHRALARTSNSRFYMRLLGDTSYIVHYLRWLGYDLRGVRQTGSNFGEVVKHDTPFLNTVRSGTMVADGLSHHERRLLELVLPSVPGVDRGGELPREPDRLPRTGQDG